MHGFTTQALSEDTFLLRWELAAGQLPTPSLAKLIGGLANYLIEYPTGTIINAVPAYQTLMVQYDVLATTQKAILLLIDDCLTQSLLSEQQLDARAQVVRIPVFYDSQVAPDLLQICDEKSMSSSELSRLHSEQLYTVYAVGFQPGFAYMGHVPAALELPRLSSFRDVVAAGSVAIADRQTAVYPSDLPGGWQIIGRTPMPMLQSGQGLLRAGDQVEFYAVDQHQYLQLGGDL